MEFYLHANHIPFTVNFISFSLVYVTLLRCMDIMSGEKEEIFKLKIMAYLNHCWNYEKQEENSQSEFGTVKIRCFTGYLTFHYIRDILPD
jgi:hypothetical protein